MSQEAYTRFSPELKPGGILITEQELVRVDQFPQRSPRVRRAGHAAGRGVGPQGGAQYRDGGLLWRRHRTWLAPDSLRKAVADSVPPAMQQLNLQAFDKGFAYGSELMIKLSEQDSDAVVSTLEVG